jgi:hypothetical protein
MVGQSRTKRVKVVLLVLSIPCLVAGFGLWALTRIEPHWFSPPAWLDAVFFIIGGLGVLIRVLISVIGDFISNIVLALRDLSRREEHPWLRDQSPIRQVDYDALIGRLGPSGRIPWIDRGVTSPGLLLEHGNIAIVAEMKSGKTREATELIRRAQEEGWISIVYEPTVALDLIDEDTLAYALAGGLRHTQRSLFFVDELGLRQDAAHLAKLDACIRCISEWRPDLFLLITIQRERLGSQVLRWLNGLLGI